MSHRVLFADHTFEDLAIERGILEPLGATVVDGEASDEPLADLVADVDALLVMFADVDADVIDRMERCAVISRTGIGVDNVDVEAATERGIYVTNVPDYCFDEVADHTLAMALAHARNLFAYDRSIRAGEWDVGVGREMHRLAEQTFGLVAFGNIARNVATRAAAFGMDVLVFDPYVPAEEIEAAGYGAVDDLHDLLGRSDVVSLHAPLTPETEGLLDAEAFAAMRETAIVVNAARGGLVDEDALLAALDAGEIAGAALDVRETEPPGADDPLVAHDRVVQTPHAAWLSAESVVELREKAAHNVRAALEGEVPAYVVNEAVLE